MPVYSWKGAALCASWMVAVGMVIGVANVFGYDATNARLPDGGSYTFLLVTCGIVIAMVSLTLRR